MSAAKNTWDLAGRDKTLLTKREFKKVLASQSQRRKDDTFYSLGVFDASGALVGAVSLMEVARGVSHSAYLGYRIFNTHWSLGYGKEAVQAVLDIGFKDLKLHRIEAGIEPRNIRSIKLARTLGMRHEGKKKRAIFLRNQWVDLLIYSLTTEDLGLKFDTTNLKPLT